MFGVFPFGVPYFADPGAEILTPTPATAHRIRDTFDHWINGVPLIVPEFDGSFSQWLNVAPDVEQGGQAVIEFTGSGVSAASALLRALANPAASGLGVASASAVLGTAIPPTTGSGTGVSESSALLTALSQAIASGSGVSLGSAQLIAKVPTLAGVGFGRSAASVSLSSYPSLRARGTALSSGSARISSFISVVIGPAMPGYPSIQESLPKLITMFGYTMQPILDVLKLRYVPLNYISPPICQPANPITSGSAFATPMIL